MGAEEAGEGAKQAKFVPNDDVRKGLEQQNRLKYAQKEGSRWLFVGLTLFVTLCVCVCVWLSNFL